MGKANAIVVLCPHRPDLLGQPLLGHVAWGFEYPNGEWLIGAVEGPDWNGGLNGFWSVRRPNLRSALMYFAQMKNRNAEYNYYKLLTVSPGAQPDPRYAERMARWVSQQKYELFGRNCMNSAYDILRAFSGGQYNNTQLPHPDHNWIPNGWFNAIETPDYYNLPTVFTTRSREEQPVPFDISGEVQAPEWRALGAELEIRDHSDDKKVEAIKILAPSREQVF